MATRLLLLGEKRQMKLAILGLGYVGHGYDGPAGRLYIDVVDDILYDDET